MSFTIKQLQAFLSLAKHRNFTLAAQNLHLSQSAFSAQISSLEQSLNFRLFDRDTRHVKLTKDGELFFSHAESQIRLYMMGVDMAKSIALGRVNRLCIAALPSVSVNWLPRLIHDWEIKYPDVDIRLIDTFAERCINFVIDGIADIALTFDDNPQPRLRKQLIYREKFYLVCHIDHPLALLDTIDIDQIFEHRFLHFSPVTSIARALSDFLPLQENRFGIEAEQLTTMMGFINANLGVTLIPELALYQFNHQHLIHKPVMNLQAERKIYLFSRNDANLNQTIKNFCDALFTYLPKKEKPNID